MSETPEALAPREQSESIGILEKVQVRTYEEEEDVRFKRRAKLFRFDTQSSEWKERGTGEVKILENRETGRCRVLMRREQTLKIATNFSITSDMKLQPNIGSDRSWVCKVHADYADQSAPVSVTLAVRFANSDDANQFKAVFEDARTKNAALSAKETKEGEEVVSEKATEGEVKEVEAKKEDEVEKEEVKKDEEDKVKREDEVKKEDEADAGKDDTD